MGHSVITIDGPSGSGKSTVSRLLAKELGWVYLDTGAMYRAVALAAKRAGVDPGDGEGLGELCREMDLRLELDREDPRLMLGGEDISTAIRSPDMDMGSSRVSAVPQVREALTDLQRAQSRTADLVAEGRDMGTVVFPDARYKFFLTASPDVRMERRYQERKARGEAVFRAAVKKEMEQRDLQDQMRALAPLVPAGDATVIDSTRLAPEEVVLQIVNHIRGKGKLVEPQ